MGVAGVLGAALLCAIHGATVENNLFEDGDGANIFRAFNPTQAETFQIPHMSYWACQFDVAHLISSYPRINKFDPALFIKFWLNTSFFHILDTEQYVTAKTWKN